MWQAAVNAVALLSTVGNVAFEKNVQGIWQVGLNWSVGRSLGTPDVDWREVVTAHTLVGVQYQRYTVVIYSPNTDTNFWEGMPCLDNQFT